MLSSITPLGQRGRGMSWGRTVVGFWVGAAGAGAVVFGFAGWLGALSGVVTGPLWAALLVVLAAAVLDLAGVHPPGPKRQVDENWLGAYRDWVTGLGYGAQLGVGFATIVPTWGTWALLAVSLLVGWPGAVLIGVGFGVGRSLLLMATRRVRSTGSLATTMRRFVAAERTAQRVAVAGYGLVVLMVGVYVV